MHEATDVAIVGVESGEAVTVVRRSNAAVPGAIESVVWWPGVGRCRRLAVADGCWGAGGVAVAGGGAVSR